MDETSYNKKSRLEFWIGFIGDRIRKSKYLTTIEIDVLTKVTQDPKLSVYEQLQHMLQVIAQLMSRMGLSVEISSRSYISKLFIEDERSGKKVPRVFVSKKKQLETSNLPLVTILQIIRNWGTGWTVVISDWSEWRATY